MVEWLEVRLDVGYDKRLVYEYCTEPLKCDSDALKQECRLVCSACSGTQPPTHLSENIRRPKSYCRQSFEHDWYKKKAVISRLLLQARCSYISVYFFVQFCPCYRKTILNMTVHYMEGSQNFKTSSRDPFPTPFDLILNMTVHYK